MIREVQINGTSFRVNYDSNTQFWRKVEAGTWEPETFAIFDAHITPKTLFVDIGAWIGPTLLYAAQKAKSSIAFEPDPIAFDVLKKNLAANEDTTWASSVQIVNAGINSDGEPFYLGGVKGGGKSVSSALFPQEQVNWRVEAHRLPDILKQHAASGQHIFLKIDVEGGEYNLLPAIAKILAQSNVTSFISLHSRFLRLSLRGKQETDNLWLEKYFAAHDLILDAIPWQRSVTAKDGTRLAADDLRKDVRDRKEFVSEILISGKRRSAKSK